MTTSKNLWSAVRSCSIEHWRSAGTWLAYTIGCGFLPVMFGLLAVFLLSFALNWYEFVIHGELAIYSAALIAGSARLISRDTETFPFVHRQMFTLVAIIGIVASVGLYSMIKTATLLNLQSTINSKFIARFSVPLVIVSLIFSFVVFLLDQQRLSPNVRGIAKDKEKELSDAFDSLGNVQ